MTLNAHAQGEKRFHAIFDLVDNFIDDVYAVILCNTSHGKSYISRSVVGRDVNKDFARRLTNDSRFVVKRMPEPRPRAICLFTGT